MYFPLVRDLSMLVDVFGVVCFVFYGGLWGGVFFVLGGWMGVMGWGLCMVCILDMENAHTLLEFDGFRFEM